MPNDLVASRSRATANPAAARSRASSHDAGRSPPLSRTSGSVNRTCLLIERTFPGGQLPSPSLLLLFGPVYGAVYRLGPIRPRSRGRVGAWPPGLAAATTDAAVSGLAGGGGGGSAWPGLADPGLGRDLDGVPGAAQRRGVGQVQIADLIHGHAVEDSRRGDVGPLGDLGVLMAEQLQAEQ